MDFKQLISKIDSIEAPQATPAAPKLPTPVQLNEDAELRVLAGTSTILAEAKKMKKDDMKKKDVKEEFDAGEEEKLPVKKEKQEPVAEASDRPDAKKTATTWKDKSGKEHPATKVQGHASRKADKDAEKETKATMKKEGIEPEFKSKFMKMVEAAVEKDEKKKAEADKKKKEEKKKKIAKIMDEGAKPDFLDLDKDGNKKEPMKSAAASKGGDKKDGKKGMSAKQAKYFGKKNESVTASKKIVAESVEGKMSFRDMMKLVVESGGQQQIDPLDKALFAWATRIAENKMGEGLKSQVYAGMVYERMGGRFEMYDVLSEDQK